MTYIEWPPHIALEEDADVPSANYVFRRRVRVRRNAPKELANVVTPNATAKIRARNLAEGSLRSTVE
jgi:hypothetical protein